MSCASVCDTITSFLRKFFSLIIAILIAIMTLLFVVGAGRLITLEGNFAKAGFAHFLAILVSIVTAIGYIALHFIPRKAYRLLYALTGLFIVSMLLVSHSMGLTGMLITYCGYDLQLNTSSNYSDLGNYFWKGTDEGFVTTSGFQIRNCPMNELTFAAAFLLQILYVIGLFDVQHALLARVKSKTYGERFVEMGISN